MANKLKEIFMDTKTDEEPWRGGVEINLKRKTKDGEVLKDALTAYVKQLFNRETENQEKLIQKIQKWNKQFRGIKKEKTHPYVGCSNLAIPLSRWLTDTVLVRLIDAIFSQVRVWIVKALDSDWVEIAPELEDGLDWWQKWVAHFRKTIFSPLLQCMKMGTGIVKLEYKRKKETVYRRATAEEIKNKKIKKYVAKNGTKLIKEPQTIYDGPVLKAISREDFIISSDAADIQDARLVGYRVRMPSYEFKLLCKQKFYDITEEEKESILLGDELDETKQKRIKDGQKDYREEYENIDVWVLHLKYDVDDDDEVDDIILSYNPRTSTILRAIYNENFYGWRPFKKFVFNPVEYSFDGEGTCQILEHLQEEVDTVHNQRIDRMNQICAPVYLRKAGTLAKNIEHVRPGMIIDVDDIDDIQELKFSDVYPSTWQEEGLINQYAQQAVGVTPHVMGQTVAERPVARETLALIQEANKKFKFGIDNIREDLEELGMMVLEMIAQYQPTLIYKVEKEGEQFDTKSVTFPSGYIRNGVKVDLMASSEVLNTEVRREIDLTIYQMLKDYSTAVASMLQAFPQVNPALQMFIVQDLAVGSLIMRRIIRDFGIVDADELVPNPLDDPRVKQMLQNPPPPQQPQPPAGGQAAPQGGTGGQERPVQPTMP